MVNFFGKQCGVGPWATITHSHSYMTERNLTEISAAELTLAPSAARKERSFRTEEIRSVVEEELSMPIANFLIAEIERLAEENQQLKQFQNKFHDIDKRLAILKETLKQVRRNELLASTCLAAGAAGLGAAPNFVSLNSYGWYVFVIVCILLVLVGIGVRRQGPLNGTAARN